MRSIDFLDATTAFKDCLVLLHQMRVSRNYYYLHQGFYSTFIITRNREGSASTRAQAWNPGSAGSDRPQEF